MVKHCFLAPRRATALAVFVALAASTSCAKIFGIDQPDGEVPAGAGAPAGGRGGAAGASSPSAGTGASAGTASGDGAMDGGAGSGAERAGGASGEGGAENPANGGRGATRGKGGSGGAGRGGEGTAADATGDVSGRSAGGDAGDTHGDSGGESIGGGGEGFDACGGVTTRCTNGVREVCTHGSWQTSACPLDAPSCNDGECSVRGPKLVSAGAYYIEATEVTVADYAEFTAAKGDDTSGQTSACSWNTSFAPAMDPGGGELPISYVNWCDAAAYCRWADEHLCGRIGGGTLGVDDIGDAAASQWFWACGGGGLHVADGETCNTVHGDSGAVPVGTTSGCEGYYPGLFDMEGNVAEWVDICDGDTGADDVCYPVGGSFIDESGYCSAYYEGMTRSEAAPTIGFRCCSG